MLTKRDVIEFIIARRPGITHRELVSAIWGPHPKKPNEPAKPIPYVAQDCDHLYREGRVEFSGGGTIGDPYRYYAKDPHRKPTRGHIGTQIDSRFVTA